MRTRRLSTLLLLLATGAGASAPVTPGGTGWVIEQVEECTTLEKMSIPAYVGPSMPPSPPKKTETKIKIAIRGPRIHVQRIDAGSSGATKGSVFFDGASTFLCERISDPGARAFFHVAPEKAGLCQERAGFAVPQMLAALANADLQINFTAFRFEKKGARKKLLDEHCTPFRYDATAVGNLSAPDADGVLLQFQGTGSATACLSDFIDLRATSRAIAGAGAERAMNDYWQKGIELEKAEDWKFQAKLKNGLQTETSIRRLTRTTGIHRGAISGDLFAVPADFGPGDLLGAGH